MSICNSSKVAVFGLGIIGSRAAARLIDAGWKVACWNRTPKGFAGETSSPAEAADGAAVISIYLKDAPALRDVVGRIDRVLKPGQIILKVKAASICGSDISRYVKGHRMYPLVLGHEFIGVDFTAIGRDKGEAGFICNKEWDICHSRLGWVGIIP